MEIISKNGMVEFTLIAGKDRVKGRMLKGEALELIHKGNVKKKGNTITVDEKFIFDIEGEVEDKPLVESAMPQEEVKEDKPLTNKRKDDKPLTKNSKRKPKRK